MELDELFERSVNMPQIFSILLKSQQLCFLSTLGNRGKPEAKARPLLVSVDEVSERGDPLVSMDGRTLHYSVPAGNQRP